MKTYTGCSSEFSPNLKLVKRSRGQHYAFRSKAVLGAIAVASLTLLLTACQGGISLFAGVPVIVSITPDSTAAGGPAQTITITGTGFNSAVPLANGVALTITSVSSTQIVATIPASLIASPGSIVIVVVNLLPSGNLTSRAATITVTNSTENVPELTISKSHTGDFTQGGTGTYTLAVSNVGNAATNGTVTVTENPPVTALTVTDMSGSGWTCTITNFTCTRSDSLPAASGYPTITVTVAVATNAPATATNGAAVSGGGSAGATATDPTTINPPASPQLAASIVANGTFVQGGTGSYTITVSNISTAAATNGPVSVTVTLAPSETAGTPFGGTGSTCNVSTVTCTFSGTLAPGGTFTITMDVNIAASSDPPPATVTIVVSGGGSSPVTAMVTTTVNAT
jgi:uncharacterized repeat protein (TIGR01451 family)